MQIECPTEQDKINRIEKLEKTILELITSEVTCMFDFSFEINRVENGYICRYKCGRDLAEIKTGKFVFADTKALVDFITKESKGNCAKLESEEKVKSPEES